MLHRPLIPLVLITSLACCAQEVPGDDNGSTEQNQIELSELPEPPQEIAELIKRGAVTLHVGKRQKPGSSSTGQSESGTLAAETYYQLGFDYRCKTRWNARIRGGRRVLTVTVTYSKIKLNQTHQVWFKKRPRTDRFWDGKLVLHEFDHVRLSSDPSIEKRFHQRLKEQATITKEIDADVKLDDAYARKLVADYVQTVFDDTIALIDIRYQELDRQTKHGILPLPEDSKLAEWLR